LSAHLHFFQSQKATQKMQKSYQANAPRQSRNDGLATKEKETTNAQHHLSNMAVYSKFHHLCSQ